MMKLVVLSPFTVFGTSIQLANPTSFSSWHCVTLSLFMYFIIMAEFDSSFDTLTGLYNRDAFNKAAKQIAEKKSFSVIVLDINNSKSINDTYGYDCGDTVIKMVADIIRKSFGKKYTSYRYGGDEFYIISEETDQEKIEGQLRIMTNNLEDMRRKGNAIPTVSYGYSILREGDKLDFFKTLREADAQMYHLKKAQKGGADNKI